MIVDFEQRKVRNQLNGYNSGFFNIIITAYDLKKSDLEKYKKSNNNYEILRKEDVSIGDSDSLVSSFFTETSSNSSITEPEDSGKTDLRWSLKVLRWSEIGILANKQAVLSAYSWWLMAVSGCSSRPKASSQQP